MPRSYRPAHYGPEYEHLLRRAHSNAGFELTLPSPQHAAVMRGKVYAYFKSLRIRNERPDLIAMCDSLSLTVEDCTLRAFPTVDSWDACLLRDALGIELSTPLPEAPASIVPVEPTAQDKLRAKLAELRAMREAKEKGKA